MSLKKFEERRLLAQRKHEEEMARLYEEEKKERQKRVAPLIARYTNIFQDVVTKALNDRVDDLESPKFRKAGVRQRLEAAFALEIVALLGEDSSDDGESDQQDDLRDAQDSAPTSAEESSQSSTSQSTPSDSRGPGFFDTPSLDSLAPDQSASA